MKKLDLTKNTGLLIGSRPEDYVLGANSPIPLEARNLKRDWREFRSRPERQNYIEFDATNCTSHTITNLWESTANWMLANNLWPEDALKFWNTNEYIVNGKFEISERFLTKMSGNTRQGNYFYKVFDCVRKDGVVPESKWFYQVGMNWDNFYAEPAEEIKLLGRESLKYFNLLYESIPAINPKYAVDLLFKGLEHAPIAIGIGTCSPWDESVPACGMSPNHAVLLDHIEDKAFNIFDSYDPVSKTLEAGYPIYTAYKGILYPIKRNEPIVKSETLEKDITFGEISDEVLRVRSALNRLGWKNLVGWNVYDSELADVVWKYQLANLSWPLFW
ncbi:MAG: hypothetical protein AAB456_02490, partial [Patescibacteria group bacterium]